MQRYSVKTICISSVIAVGLAMMCHELGHVLAGSLAGGTPTLITSTEVKGDFDSLSPAGFVALGISGFVVNVIFCVVAWWIARRRPAVAELQLLAWFSFAVNGMLVMMGAAVEPLFGFGDWMTILHALPGTALLRVLFTVLGTIGLIVMTRRAGYALGRLLPTGDPGHRMAEARRVVLIGAAVVAILVVGSSVANPIGTTRGTLLALGAGLGPFLPMMAGTRFVPRSLPGSDLTRTNGGILWVVASVAVTAVLWFVFGPGIAL
jgi:hypothetical protein